MYICQHCAKECKNTNSHKNHERICPSNKERVYKNGMLGKKASNQWIKAKQTGVPYVIREETRKKFSESSSKLRHSEETKRLISEKRKKFLEKNPDKVPYLLNHHSKISYPEQYFLDCFSDINENKEFRYRVHSYELDFANPKEKLYLEIDGEQHYVDKRIVEHDERRSKKLSELGWQGIRIRWSHFQKLTEIEKHSKIQEIRSMMKWLS